MVRKVFCFGSEYFAGDEVARRLAGMLDIPGFEFVVAESPSDILQASDDLLILDVVKGLDHVALIDDVKDLEICKSVTCHDMDLAFYLRLMKESGKITTVKIIGLPWGEKDLKKLEEEVVAMLATL